MRVLFFFRPPAHHKKKWVVKPSCVTDEETRDLPIVSPRERATSQAAVTGPDWSPSVRRLLPEFLNDRSHSIPNHLGLRISSAMLVLLGFLLALAPTAWAGPLAAFGDHTGEDHSFETEHRNGNLESIILVNANLEGTDFRNINFLNAVFDGANLASADLRNANLTGASAVGADLDNANLKNTRLNNSDLSGASLVGVNARNAQFTNSTVDGADLSGANIRNAQFTGADLSNTILFDVEATNANFTNAIVNGVVFGDADLRNANFAGASLLGADLSNIADQTNTNFTGALFDSSTLFAAGFDTSSLVFVPEPSSALLMALGLIGLASYPGRRRGHSRALSKRA